MEIELKKLLILVLMVFLVATALSIPSSHQGNNKHVSPVNYESSVSIGSMIGKAVSVTFTFVNINTSLNSSGSLYINGKMALNFSIWDNYKLNVKVQKDNYYKFMFVFMSKEYVPIYLNTTVYGPLSIPISPSQNGQEPSVLNTLEKGLNIPDTVFIFSTLFLMICLVVIPKRYMRKN